MERVKKHYRVAEICKHHDTPSDDDDAVLAHL